MASFFVLFIVFLTGIIQVTFFPANFSSGIAPDLILILIIFWAVSEGFEKAWKKIVLAGLVLDTISFNVWGINTFSLVIIAFGAGFAARSFLVSRRILGFLIIMGLVALGTAVNLTILSFLGKFYHFFSGKNIELAASEIFEFSTFMKIMINSAIFSLFYIPLLKMEKIILLLENRQKRTI